MRTSVILSIALLAASSNASWFSSDDKPEYESWDTQQLHHWLEANSIKTPENYGQKDLRKLVASNWESHKPWTQATYESAQQYYQGVSAADAFDTWDESKLRSWLVQQGVVEPKTPREALIVSAKNKYRQYTAAASSLSAQASADASTAVYGDSAHQASKSASSIASHASKSATSIAFAASGTGAAYASSASSIATDATKSASSAYASATAFAAKKLDDTTDYVYSTWDDNQLRTYLENKGMIKTKQQATRDELLAKMKGAYNSATDPVYNAWSDSYMKQWLVAHGIIKSDYEAKRDYYMSQLKSYYYGPQDKVWNAWSDSDTKAWLVKNGYVKSDAQVTREKMQNMVAKNYYNAKDTAWSAWDDASMTTWLVDQGYLRSDAVSTTPNSAYPDSYAAAVADRPAHIQEVKRDELTKLMNEKYNDLHSRTSDYLTWPDARLRAYLRSHGVDDTKVVPGSRPSLLQEVRIRYHQTNNRVDQLIASIRDTINAGVGSAEAKLAQVMDMLKGGSDTATDYAVQGTDAASAAAADYTDGAKASASSAASAAGSTYSSAKKSAADKAAGAAGAAERQAGKAKKSAEDARDEL
ncbi:hypothetical protein FRB96_008584 [Tulasnella sp. 330]|nr:hypothetical protein FRB96_008584 [Tulasnella sp. 330]KAG8872201.1 hypothetical protein FRB97_007883 [Tulasnella sp. 331]KAG8889008.1 hypothetical protein FRB98_006056 [Tulasnella sp. 332]